MSQHSSLRVDSVGVKHRNVLKRLERIRKMQEENKWKDRVSIFNLPKIKSVKIKVKKVKEVKAAGAEGATPAAPPAVAAGQKPAVQPKAAGDKSAKSKA